MARYRSNQGIKAQIKQKQLLENQELKIATVLRARSQQDPKTIRDKTNSNTETRSNQKRKLLVYRKDGKFYIDHSAAYALKLTNIRAIMTENPHLFEIGIETLFKFQNDEDIEIEYQELNKDKETGKQESDLTETLDKLEEGEYGI